MRGESKNLREKWEMSSLKGHERDTEQIYTFLYPLWWCDSDVRNSREAIL